MSADLTDFKPEKLHVALGFDAGERLTLQADICLSLMRLEIEPRGMFIENRLAAQEIAVSHLVEIPDTYGSIRLQLACLLSFLHYLTTIQAIEHCQMWLLRLDRPPNGFGFHSILISKPVNRIRALEGCRHRRSISGSWSVFRLIITISTTPLISLFDNMATDRMICGLWRGISNKRVLRTDLGQQIDYI